MIKRVDRFHRSAQIILDSDVKEQQRIFLNSRPLPLDRSYAVCELPDSGLIPPYTFCADDCLEKSRLVQSDPLCSPRALVLLVYEVGDRPHFSLSSVLPSVLGAALAIFLGFRSNTAYARWGQAAQAWGGIQNSVSVSLGASLSPFPKIAPAHANVRCRTDKGFSKGKKYRLVAFVNILCMKLRNQSEWAMAIKDFLSEQEYEQVVGKTNPLLALLVLQGHQIYSGMREGTLMGFDSFQMEGQMAQLSALSMPCEHIKAIPIPRQYTFFTRFFVWFFLLIIPFSFVKTFDDYFEDHQGIWLIIPVSLLLAFCVRNCRADRCGE